MGTPAFIVGDRLSNGALDYASLKAEIADARAAGGKAAAAVPATAAPAAPQSTVEATGEPKGAANPVVAPPLFTQRDPRPPSSENSPVAADTALPPLAWVAVLAAIAALVGGWWFVQRRRVARAT